VLGLKQWFKNNDMTFIVGNDEEGNKQAVEVHGGALSVSAALLELSLGHIEGYESVTIEGNNMDVDVGVEDVWSEGGTLVYLSAAEKMNIASASLNDASAGIGARTLRISGLDSSHDEISEEITLNGTTDVLTVNSYLRVIMLEILTAGSLGENNGAITATAETAGTVQCAMGATTGLSKNSHFTVPAGKQLIILAAELNSTKLSGGQVPNMEINALVRKLGESPDAPWLKVVQRRIDTTVIDQLFIDQPVSSIIGEKSDFRFTAESDVSNAQVRVRVYGVLFDV